MVVQSSPETGTTASTADFVTESQETNDRLATYRSKEEIEQEKADNAASKLNPTHFVERGDFVLEPKRPIAIMPGSPPERSASEDQGVSPRPSHTRRISLPAAGLSPAAKEYEPSPLGLGNVPTGPRIPIGPRLPPTGPRFPPTGPRNPTVPRFPTMQPIPAFVGTRVSQSISRMPQTGQGDARKSRDATPEVTTPTLTVTTAAPLESVSAGSDLPTFTDPFTASTAGDPSTAQPGNSTPVSGSETATAPIEQPPASPRTTTAPEIPAGGESVGNKMSDSMWAITPEKKTTVQTRITQPAPATQSTVAEPVSAPTVPVETTVAGSTSGDLKTSDPPTDAQLPTARQPTIAEQAISPTESGVPAVREPEEQTIPSPTAVQPSSSEQPMPVSHTPAPTKPTGNKMSDSRWANIPDETTAVPPPVEQAPSAPPQVQPTEPAAIPSKPESDDTKTSTQAPATAESTSAPPSVQQPTAPSQRPTAVSQIPVSTRPGGNTMLDSKWAEQPNETTSAPTPGQSQPSRPQVKTTQQAPAPSKPVNTVPKISTSAPREAPAPHVPASANQPQAPQPQRQTTTSRTPALSGPSGNKMSDSRWADETPELEKEKTLERALSPVGESERGKGWKGKEKDEPKDGKDERKDGGRCDRGGKGRKRGGRGGGGGGRRK